MGWCSGTEIFDVVAKHLVDKAGSVSSDKEKINLLADLIDVLCSQDWDCETDSDYIDHPLIRAAFIRYNPNWIEYFKERDEWRHSLTP